MTSSGKKKNKQNKASFKSRNTLMKIAPGPVTEDPYNLNSDRSHMTSQGAIGISMS